MMGYTFQELRRAIERINNRYGRGDIVDVWITGKLCGKFTRKPYGMAEETRRFRVRNLTVFALGHQCKIPISPDGGSGLYN